MLGDIDGAGVLLCLMILMFKLITGSEQNVAHSLFSPSFDKELGTNLQLGKGCLSKLSYGSGCGDFISLITAAFNSTEYDHLL